MDKLDLVVIGSGWYGLAAAKTYIQLHPSENVAVLDSSTSVGGVWARERLYPGLNSNNMLGTYEYSDFPMDEATFGVAPGQHIPGTVVHSYLTKYAKHFGVYGRIRFNTLVETVEHHERGGWVLSVQHVISGSKMCLIAQRLIIATGLTSEAYMPTIAGSDSFGSPIFHPKDFARHRDTLTEVHNVSVLGGSKSAWDATYAYASAGVPVDMIIRKSGHGPVWMAPPYVTPLKRWLEKLVHTRFLTWFSPCIWGEEDGYVGIRRFLHGTWLGRKLVDAFWHILGNDVDTLISFDKHPEVKKLKPWHDAFWISSGLSMLNYPTDFFELVRNGMIRIHVADINHLSGNTVHLTNGEDVKADVLVCTTGWKPQSPINFLLPSIVPQLGLPHYAPATDELVRKADAVIFQQFPRLKDQPTVNHSEHEEDGSEGENPNQPFRLYRFMVPPALLEDRNIAFTGMIATISTSICSQIQGLWISAFFDGRLDRLPGSLEQAQWQSTLHSQFGRRRYPCGYGARFPDFVFDAVPYVDMLLQDVNLEPHRKKGRLAETVEPYGPEDYKNLPVEWANAHGVSIYELE